MTGASTHRRGVLIAGAGVLVISPDSLLIRLAEAGDWKVVFWRGVFTAACLSLYLGVRHRTGVAALFRAGGNALCFCALLSALATLLFVLSILHTSVANTLVILAVAPFSAAVFTRLFLGEVVPWRTWGAIAAAILGVAVVFMDSLGGGRLLGNLYAVGAACTLGGNLVVLRKSRDLDMIPSYCLGSALLALCCAPMVSGFGLTLDALIVFLAMGTILAVASALIVVGTRYIPAPEVSLLFVLETVFGSIWVWLALGERPSVYLFLGGAVVIATVVAHSVFGIRAARALAVPS